MELRQLRYFVTVAEEASFSRAARKLFVSQPPLSIAVKNLEDEMGVQLLERTNRGVTVTAAGQLFLDEARGALQRLEMATEKARAVDRGEAGTLAIGFVSIADYGILPPALKLFRAKFPGVQVQLHELTTDAQIMALRSGKLDLGIGLGPVEEADIEFHPVHQEELVLAAPTDHGPAALRRRGAVSLGELGQESFIVPPRDIAPGLYDLTISLCHAAGFSPQITQHARQMQTVIGLVSCGMGCALVPASVRNLNRAGVQYRKIKGPAATVDLGVLFVKERPNILRKNFAATLFASKTVSHTGT